MKAATVFFGLVAIVMILYGAIRSDDTTYRLELSVIQIIVMFIAAIIVCIAVILIIKSHREMKRSIKSEQDEQKALIEDNTTQVNQTLESTTSRDTAKPHDELLIAKLLKADERRIYGIISSAGGQVFQSKIVTQSGFSKAKVTRLLDKLEERGLVVRERNGLSNRVRILK